MTLVFKIADEPAEIEQIHRLNYRAFVEEIPQHPPNPERRLVDVFHAENTYIVGIFGGRVVGMLALRDRRPFSLDAKIPDLDSHLPPGRRVCEVRLLYVEPGHRGGRALPGLLRLAAGTLIASGLDFGVLSASTRQLKLYRHLGCVPFGPLVGTEQARYQPMYLELETLRRNAALLFNLAPQCRKESPRGGDGARPLREKPEEERPYTE